MRFNQKSIAATSVLALALTGCAKLGKTFNDPATPASTAPAIGPCGETVEQARQEDQRGAKRDPATGCVIGYN